jgi:hypothetical protein
LLAIETSDFDRCLQLVGASHARAAAGMYGFGPVGASTQRRDIAADSLQMQRVAITAAIRDWASQRARGIEDAPTSAYAAVVLNWTLAGRTPAMRVLSRLDARPTKKYTSALS